VNYIALLRGVNVGGHRLVAMADLRDLCGRLGLEDAQTILQSGNLVFRAKAGQASQLERVLETEAQKQLGLETSFFVRSAAEWRALVAGNPFPEEAKRDPGHFLAMPLKEAPKAAAVRALRAAIPGRERVEVRGQEAYLVYPDGVGRSRLTIALIERKLGTRGTGRNWNTVLKLHALAGD
jgi:uncharacterized protein (DUF1697 family)